MVLSRIRFTILLATILASNVVHAQAPGPFEMVITNGHIIDGTGSPWYSGDIGIREGKIAAIGNLSAMPRQRTIDAAGKVGTSAVKALTRLPLLFTPMLGTLAPKGIRSMSDPRVSKL